MVDGFVFESLLGVLVLKLDNRVDKFYKADVEIYFGF